MTRIFYLPLYLLIGLIVSVGLLPSCEKKDDLASDKVELLSFGPTGAQHGDTLHFIGNNLDKVTAIDLTGASVPQASFLQQTAERILIIVPQETEQGVVTLKTPEGDIVSKTALNLGVTTTVASVTDEARPGESITISGNYLNWVTRVTFANDKPVDSFVSQSMDQLVVTVPEDAQTGTLVLSYSGTDPMDVETEDTLKVTLPAITNISPNPVKHESDLTITGTNLDLTKKIILMGDTVTTFVSQSRTQIIFNVPARTQKGKVTLEAASGVQTASTVDLDVVLPAVTKMSPNPVDPGANLTITGTNLDLVDSITFSNAPAVKTFVSQTPTQLVLKVPMGVLRGNVKLAVKNSTLIVQSPDVLEIVGDVPPPTIAFPIYNDAVTSNWTSTGWIGGGWGGTKDLDNTSPVREGTKSVKITYESGYGSPLQLGHNAGAGINASAYTTLKVSIYGAPGSAGKRVNIAVNGKDGYTVTLVEGKWTDYEIPLSTLMTTSVLSEILVKEYSGTGGFTIYVDALGLN